MKGKNLNIFKKITKKNKTEPKIMETRDTNNFENETWPEFLVFLQRDILPLYVKHEKTFDHYGVHGRLHICRALIFAEVMNRYYLQETDMKPSVSAVRYAVAFHDSGRQGNGIDIWEEDSAQNCTNYLSHFIAEEKAKEEAMVRRFEEAWMPNLNLFFFTFIMILLKASKRISVRMETVMIHPLIGYLIF